MPDDGLSTMHTLDHLVEPFGQDPDCPHYQAARDFPWLVRHECRRRDDRLVRAGIDSCHAGAEALLRQLRQRSAS